MTHHCRCHFLNDNCPRAKLNANLCVLTKIYAIFKCKMDQGNRESRYAELKYLEQNNFEYTRLYLYIYGIYIYI